MVNKHNNGTHQVKCVKKIFDTLAVYLYIIYIFVNIYKSCCLLVRLRRAPPSKQSTSNFQNPPLPGSSLDRGTFTKNLFSDKLCLIEFLTKIKKKP